MSCFIIKYFGIQKMNGFGKSAFRNLVLAAIKLNGAAKIPIDLYQKTQMHTDNQGR